MSIVRKALVSLGALAVWLSTGVAAAQEDESSWRLPHSEMSSPQNFALEFRFGPYRPRVDDAFPGDNPYQSVFGDSSQLLFGMEFDWQTFRIPMVGTIGPGLGWSYTRVSTRARNRNYAELGLTEFSAENTYLWVMPMYAAAVLRVDVLPRELSIPIVGYAKLGVGFGLYQTGNDKDTLGKGHTWGKHFAVGGMLLLNAFDRHAALQLDNETGINNAYLFVEWMDAALDGFAGKEDKSVMRIGTRTWVAGLAFEM